MMHPNMIQVYGVYDEKCPTASGIGKPGPKITIQVRTASIRASLTHQKTRVAHHS